MLRLQGEDLDVTPIQLGELGRMTKAVLPLWQLIAPADGEPDFAALALQGGDQLITALSVALRRDPEWVAKLDLAEAVKAARVVFEVNTDFFTQTLLPTLAQTMAEGVELTSSLQRGLTSASD